MKKYCLLLAGLFALLMLCTACGECGVQPSTGAADVSPDTDEIYYEPWHGC